MYALVSTSYWGTRVQISHVSDCHQSILRVRQLLNFTFPFVLVNILLVLFEYYVSMLPKLETFFCKCNPESKQTYY